MDENKNPVASGTSAKPGETKDHNPMSEPQWADSLRNMYESVVDEPIPDSFKDLLAQFDEPEKGDEAK